MSLKTLTEHNIVLDIDATLLHTQDGGYDFENLNVYTNPSRFKIRHKIYHMNLVDVTNNPGEGSITSLSGVYRPFLKEFLDFCFEYFNNVIIWSAGKRKYVEECCRLMFPIHKPALIYTWDDCDYSNKGLFKPLKNIFNDDKLKELNINEKNTFHLDDRDDVYSLNKNNGIQIPEFECELDVNQILNHDDDELLKLIAWFSLNKVKKSQDIRKLTKSSIFKKSCEDYEIILEKEAN